MNPNIIIIEGFYNRVTRKHLESYFIRIFKQLKDDDFSNQEIYDNLISILNIWKRDIKDQVFRHEQMYWGKYNTSTTKESKDYWMSIIKTSTECSIHNKIFSANLGVLTKGLCFCKISYAEILEIEISLVKAYIKSLNKQL